MVNDIFGIRLLYPSSENNTQLVTFPKTTTELKSGNSAFDSKVANIDGTVSAATNASGVIVWLEYEPDSGNDVKLLFLPSSLSAEDGTVTVQVDCDLNHEETASQGYVNDSAEWQNVEMTSHIFIKSVDSAKGYVFFEARNGYDDDKGGCCQGTAYGVR